MFGFQKLFFSDLNLVNGIKDHSIIVFEVQKLRMKLCFLLNWFITELKVNECNKRGSLLTNIFLFEEKFIWKECSSNIE